MARTEGETGNEQWQGTTKEQVEREWRQWREERRQVQEQRRRNIAEQH